MNCYVVTAHCSILAVFHSEKSAKEFVKANSNKYTYPLWISYYSVRE
jgi:hypothetical protein